LLELEVGERTEDAGRELTESGLALADSADSHVLVIHILAEK